MTRKIITTEPIRKFCHKINLGCQCRRQHASRSERLDFPLGFLHQQNISAESPTCSVPSSSLEVVPGKDGWGASLLSACLNTTTSPSFRPKVPRARVRSLRGCSAWESWSKTNKQTTLKLHIYSSRTRTQIPSSSHHMPKKANRK